MRPWIGAAVVMLDLVGLEHTDGGGEVGVDVLDVAGEAVGDGDKVAGSVTLLNRRTPGVRPPFPLVGAESRWGKTTSGRARGDQQVDLPVGADPEGFGLVE